MVHVHLFCLFRVMLGHSSAKSLDPPGLFNIGISYAPSSRHLSSKIHVAHATQTPCSNDPRSAAAISSAHVTCYG